MKLNLMLLKIPEFFLVSGSLFGAYLYLMTISEWEKIIGLVISLSSISLQIYKTINLRKLKNELNEIKEQRQARGTQLDEHEDRLRQIEAKISE